MAESEIEIVSTFRSRARMLCPAVAVVAVPNAAKRTQWAAQRAKREGMATGFPDIVCLWPGRGIAFLEFKTAKGRVSESQSEWLARLPAMGFPAFVVRDADEALHHLRLMGAPFVGRFT